ncbi:MAG: polysaccharide deacetylase [Rhizobacter sp.]|nr:polysaccharide deacetylase [Rhizobacter sp.]
MTSHLPYQATSGRDFVGYGRVLPQIRWPGKARVAVSFVLNFEEGAEHSMTDGDGHNESVYEVIDRQSVIDPCIDSHFEYGTRTAYWRIADLFAKHGARYTLSACGQAVERSPWLAQHVVAQGNEVSGHGYRWQTHAGLSETEERDIIQRTAASIEAVTGKRPIGWHTRSNSTPNTRRLLVENGFLYDSDAYNDDTPYFVNVDTPLGGYIERPAERVRPSSGRPGAAAGDLSGNQPKGVTTHRHLVLPYAFDTNDMQFQNTQRFSTGREFTEYVCDAYDWLWKEGEQAPRMLSIGLHLRMIGRPGRIGALDAILAHLRSREGAWIASRGEIAAHWLAESVA